MSAALKQNFGRYEFKDDHEWKQLLHGGWSHRTVWYLQETEEHVPRIDKRQYCGRKYVEKYWESRKWSYWGNNKEPHTYVSRTCFVTDARVFPESLQKAKQAGLVKFLNFFHHK